MLFNIISVHFVLKVWFMFIFLPLQLQSIPSVISNNDDSLAISSTILAQLRRTYVRTHIHQSLPSYTDILCVRTSTVTRYILTAQELLLCGTNTHWWVGWRNDSYEWGKLLPLDYSVLNTTGTIPKDNFPWKWIDQSLTKKFESLSHLKSSQLEIIQQLLRFMLCLSTRWYKAIRDNYIFRI